MVMANLTTPLNRYLINGTGDEAADVLARSEHVRERVREGGGGLRCARGRKTGVYIHVCVRTCEGTCQGRRGRPEVCVRQENGCVQ